MDTLMEQLFSYLENSFSFLNEFGFHLKFISMYGNKEISFHKGGIVVKLN